MTKIITLEDLLSKTIDEMIYLYEQGYKIDEIIDLETPTTVAYVGDANPSWNTNGSSELLKDLNQIIKNSPTGNVNAVVFMGDMSYISLTKSTISKSLIKDKPCFFVVGNHEVEYPDDMISIKNHVFKLPVHYGPSGTARTSYSFNVGYQYIMITNQYWDGLNDNICKWYKPYGGYSDNDGCYRYSRSDGGYIPYNLMKWINEHLLSNIKWKIVAGHESMYPYKLYIGKSLDRDINNRDSLQSLFNKYGVNAFMCGHTHYANVVKINNTYHVNTGAIGTGIDGTRDPGATITYTTATSTTFKITQKIETSSWDEVITKEYII